MAFADERDALKAQLERAGVDVREIFPIAGIDRSTWTRWQGGQVPQYDRWVAFREAADRVMAERARGCGEAA